ncbi:hypothetical protein M2459_003708 [Parabacteroides sp. PF5-5]|uniref:hypothetical protein n=1 Tax=unclassified Parabacteroides TaxID=2649774 RepID=UPI0024769E6C|nr:MULTISPECIES: hypothetical protein [unclassified Parabacteroides]MDH6307019.1 hypothetical protein [Parabacteroides sp. PH5-39]MDH6317934.1 hypothetical protein [Parabacteroides sp. PF5-13]MDH6321662.1 hypothetical protein [Parabacteroides sp. PH5-13]MDH6325413.1 hypothetical protein [Parabacteroides sp. PH5-8]MDH6329122.1 hypothetical protein [Parabacteroides sp. PH5-41]
MDKLKHFIDNNKEAFDDEFLPEGHFERFEKKLPSPPHKRQGKLFSLLSFAAAAAVTLFVFLKIQGDLKDAPIQQSTVYTCETQTEIEELRVYYNMQMNEVSAQIRALYKSEQVPGGLELLEETKRVLKSSEEFEVKVLPTLPCSDDGLFAMNQHYKNSLGSLQIMLKQMEIATEYTNN